MDRGYDVNPAAPPQLIQDTSDGQCVVVLESKFENVSQKVPLDSDLDQLDDGGWVVVGLLCWCSLLVSPCITSVVPEIAKNIHSC